MVLSVLGVVGAEHAGVRPAWACASSSSASALRPRWLSVWPIGLNAAHVSADSGPERRRSISATAQPVSLALVVDAQAVIGPRDRLPHRGLDLRLILEPVAHPGRLPGRAPPGA